jgi:uncharacterized protein (DUF433 family)
MRIAPRIEADPGICHGQPVVAGSRVIVAVVVGQLSCGASVDDVAREYGIERDDVLACLSFAANMLAADEVRAI